MQTACGHVCQCGGNVTSAKVDVQPSHAQALILSNHAIDGVGEWIWSTHQGFAESSTNSTKTSVSSLPCSTEPYQTTTYYEPELPKHGPTDLGADHVGGTLFGTWNPQNQASADLWGAAVPAEFDTHLLAMSIDVDVQAVSGAVIGCGNAFPVSPQDSLPTPSLVHSPSSARAFGSVCSSTGEVVAAHTVCSVASIPACLETPSNLGLSQLATSAQPSSFGTASCIQQQARHEENNVPYEVRKAEQGLANAFDFTSFPKAQNIAGSLSTQDAGMFWTSATRDTNSQASASGGCTAALTRTSSSFGEIHLPKLVAVPAPGWLNPDLTPADVSVEVTSAIQAQQSQAMPASEDWSFLDNDLSAWAPPATVATGSRYEPYRNSSIASTSSSSSQNFLNYSPAASYLSFSPNGRRRSVTVGSFSGPSSSLVDRVRMMSVTRPRSPSAQQHSVPSSPRLSAHTNFNSMPCRRSRPAAPASADVLHRESGERASIRERRMASIGSRGGVGSAARTPLASLLDADDLQVEGQGSHLVESSPTFSRFSHGTCTPTSSTFSVPATPVLVGLLGDSFVGGEDAGQPMEEIRASPAKIAVHHHRTKLQRNVLNEVVTSLQGAYKHCRRQFGMQEQQEHLDFAALMMTEDDPSSSNTNASNAVIIPGETKEMRKNRQKAESKMRMRRKEVAQFAALTTYARLAYEHMRRHAASDAVDTVEDLVGRSLAQVFLEHREDWVTLIALEKRLFNTVRLKLGLQELFVKKLTEKLAELTPPGL